MSDRTGTRNLGPRPAPEFESGPMPFAVKSEIPPQGLDLETVEKAVLIMFGELPTAPLYSLMLIAKDLVANAQQHVPPQPRGVIGAAIPAPTLKLGWAVDKREMVDYPFIMVTDHNRTTPQPTGKVRSGLGRVISLSHRCGAHKTNFGATEAWALVDKQVR